MIWSNKVTREVFSKSQLWCAESWANARNLRIEKLKLKLILWFYFAHFRKIICNKRTTTFRDFRLPITKRDPLNWWHSSCTISKTISLVLYNVGCITDIDKAVNRDRSRNTCISRKTIQNTPSQQRSRRKKEGGGAKRVCPSGKNNFFLC